MAREASIYLHAAIVLNEDDEVTTEQTRLHKTPPRKKMNEAAAAATKRPSVAPNMKSRATCFRMAQRKQTR